MNTVPEASSPVAAPPAPVRPALLPAAPALSAGGRAVAPARAAFAAACVAQASVATPLGAMLIARTRQGLAGAWFEGQKDHPGVLPAPAAAADPLLAAVARQLDAYFAGEVVTFDTSLDLLGTPFQRAVWQALLAVGRGATVSYGEIARRVGTPAAVRAVGAAVGRNPVSVIVPCHRVIGTGGALTGYAGGLHRKIALLRIEGAAAA